MQFLVRVGYKQPLPQMRMCSGQDVRESGNSTYHKMQKFPSQTTPFEQHGLSHEGMRLGGHSQKDDLAVGLQQRQQG